MNPLSLARYILPAALFLLCSYPLAAYSVLTHQAIIDTAWDPSLKPLILRRFPGATEEELRQAHAHAYGGAIIQDMGYYPMGSRFFSDLVHYVRSGDFVVSLIRESQDRNEYAFALGALAHYAADTQGHSVAVNRAVAIEFPKLKREFGEVVTYYQKPSAHMRMEFSFDVLQVARGNYASQAYHDFIGFEVSKPVLERAFHSTYSLDLRDVFNDLDLSIGTYRRAVSFVIPRLTEAAWSVKKSKYEKSQQRAERSRFVYRLSRASYQKEWGEKHREPGICTRVLGFVIRIVPKIGPLKILKFKVPSPQSEALFQASFNKTMDTYSHLLEEQKRPRVQLVNLDFDTGAVTTPGEYPMADDAYAKLVVKLADKPPAVIDAALRNHVLAFFRDLERPFATKKDKKEWRATVEALNKLKSPSLASMPY